MTVSPNMHMHHSMRRVYLQHLNPAVVANALYLKDHGEINQTPVHRPHRPPVHHLELVRRARTTTTTLRR